MEGAMSSLADRLAIELSSPADRPQGVVISDPYSPDFPIVFVDDEFERQTGYTAAEIMGRDYGVLNGPGTDPESVRAIRRAMEAGTEITVDLVNYRKDGSPFWNRLRLRPLYDQHGRLQYYAAAQTTISPHQVLDRPIEAVFD
jgi:PAS domain S-box-containing protein